MQCACIVLYCHLWCVWLYHIFPHCLINGTISRKKSFNIKCVFCFRLQLLCEMFLILRRIEWNIVMNVWHIHLHMKYPLFSRILMKFEFSWQILKKYTNVRFHKNPSSWSRVPCGHMDRQTWWSHYLRFAILWTRLKQQSYLKHSQKMTFGYPLCLEGLYEVVCGLQWKLLCRG